MSHAVGVVGHVDRANMVERLAGLVKPDIVSIDDGTLGCEGNHRAVWRHLANDYPHAHWAVVLEDDALPVADFTPQLEAALRVAPTPIVSLYLGRLRPPKYQDAIAATAANDQGAHWFIANRLLHAVGVAIRTTMVDSMLAYTSKPLPSRRPIDEAITYWAQAAKMPVAYTWPSLVDHADQTPVIAERVDKAPRTPGRVAWRTGKRAQWCARAVSIAMS